MTFGAFGAVALTPTPSQRLLAQLTLRLEHNLSNLVNGIRALCDRFGVGVQMGARIGGLGRRRAGGLRVLLLLRGVATRT